MPDPGTLILVPTPIGNLQDMSLRALEVLGRADALACEDTRITRKLFQRHELPLPETVFSYHEHNEARAGERILGLLGEGRTVAVCSSAGMPALSDPGYRIVSAAQEAGFRVEVLPGPSAALTALVASGLPTSSFTFKGFPPRKAGKLRTFLLADAEQPHTLVFFESPQRLAKFLAAALETLGDRRAAVCLELTKKFERVETGYLSDLAKRYVPKPPRGEATVVIAGHHPKFYRQTDA